MGMRAMATHVVGVGVGSRQAGRVARATCRARAQTCPLCVAPGRHRRTARLVVLSYGITGPLIVSTFFLSCVEDGWSGVRRADASMAQFEILRLAHRTAEY